MEAASACRYTDLWKEFKSAKQLRTFPEVLAHFCTAATCAAGLRGRRVGGVCGGRWCGVVCVCVCVCVCR